MADFGTRPYLRTRATNMFHWPPSSAGVRMRCATVRSSTSRSTVASTCSSQKLAFSSRSQNWTKACENSKFFTPSSAATPTRSRLSPANIQHRPLFSWLVTAQSSS